MTTIDPQPETPPPASPPFQFSLRTLLLVFAALASSLGVFGSGEAEWYGRYRGRK